jgi:hypothetical protein
MTGDTQPFLCRLPDRGYSYHRMIEQRLRHAFQIVQLLLERESAETVRAWLVGMNPELEDRAPVLLLAEEPTRVLQAARAFLAHG